MGPLRTVVEALRADSGDTDWEPQETCRPGGMSVARGQQTNLTFAEEHVSAKVDGWPSLEFVALAVKSKGRS